MQMYSKKIDALLEQRQEDYGDAVNNFRTIGRIWGAFLGISDIPPHVVALMMDGLKSVRCIANPLHTDSWNDKHGYTSHGQEIASES